MRSKKNEHGQAVLMGLLLLCVFGSLSIYFLFLAETAQRVSYVTNQHRQAVLSQAQTIAHKLNRISWNNTRILAGLALTANAYQEAAEAGIYLAATRPFWKREGLLGVRQVNPETQGVFNAYAKRSARGLLVARILSLENKNIVEELERLDVNLTGVFQVSQPEDAFCLGFEAGFTSNAFEFPVIDDFLSFVVGRTRLDRVGCTLRTDGFFGGSNEVIEFRSKVAQWTQTEQGSTTTSTGEKSETPTFGITFVDFEKGGDRFFKFLANAGGASATSSRLNPNHRHTAFSNYLGPSYLNFGGGVGDELQDVSFFTTAAILHRDLQKQGSCTDNVAGNQADWLCKTYVGIEDFTDENIKKIDRLQSLRSFLTSRWTAVLMSERRPL